VNTLELIELLQGQDPTREVRIAQPSHNYWHEIYAVPVTEVTVQLADVDGLINPDPDDEAYLYLVLEA
jgi:hypothetical protein